jgi:phosphotransferase system  glucose/maltose/N-acetylglucosamine-specific IIC component
MRFERESGEWTGALMVIIAVTELLFAAWFGIGLWLTWPDVPWNLLLIGGIALNILVPVLAYPWSQSVWIGLHYAFVPLDAAEEAEAITNRAGQEHDGQHERNRDGQDDEPGHSRA